MAKKIISVVSKNNTSIKVMCGVGQENYVNGDVWRFPADLYADIASYANIDVSTKERFQATLNALLQAFNEKHNAQLVASDYDVKSGKYDRATSRTTTTAQATENAQPISATADASVKISQDVCDWIKAQRQAKLEFDEIRELLLGNGWSNVMVDAHFKSAYPIKADVPAVPSVPAVPTPQ